MTITVDSTTFTQITSGADAVIQVVGTYPVDLVFAATTPTVDARQFIINSGEGFPVKDGVPTGNAYARCREEGTVAIVAVGE